MNRVYTLNYADILTKSFLVENYLNKKLSIAEIGKKIKIANSTVRDYLLRNAIPLRNYTSCQIGPMHKKYLPIGTIRPITDTKYLKIKVGVGRWISHHKFVVETYMEKKIPRGAHIHHINGNAQDNRIENLIVFINIKAHNLFHHKPQRIEPSDILFDGRKVTNVQDR